MSKLLKTSLLSIGLVSLLGLTACQSTTQTAQSNKAERQAGDQRHYRGEGRHHFNEYGQRPQHDGQRMRGEFRRGPMTEEQKAKFEKLQTERKEKYEALQKACEGKAGQNISVKIGEQTLTGTCQVHFRHDRPQPKTTPVVTPATTATTS